MTEPKRLPPLLKLVLELGPLALFFIANAYSDRFGFADDQRIYAATGLFIVATLVALAISYALIGKLPIMPMVSGVVVLVFGGLTLALQNDVSCYTPAQCRNGKTPPKVTMYVDWVRIYRAPV